MNIKLVCRSFDKRLYLLSKQLYASWGYECVRLTDQTADGYFYTILADTTCDVAVNIDEDCFITDPHGVLTLVETVIFKEYLLAGCSDVGKGVPRSGNPLVTNPFFNVINVKLLRQLTGAVTASDFRQCVKRFHYEKYKSVLKKLYPMCKGDYNITLAEPYYPFFLWLAHFNKTMYLPCTKHKDGYTSIAYNHEHEPICLHTWFARFYSTPSWIVQHFQPTIGKQQVRIETIIDEAYTCQGYKRPVWTFNDKVGFVIDKMVRWCIKVPQRIMGWPTKIHRKLQHL